MQRIGGGKLVLNVAYDALSKSEVVERVIQSFATGAERVEIEQRAFNFALGEPPRPQVSRQDGAHLQVGKIADDQRRLQTRQPRARPTRMGVVA